MGRLICSVEVLYEWMSNHTLRRWPALPRDWHTIEVPFQLRVGTPRVVPMHGLEMARNPYHPELQRKNPRAWAIWCAAHTMFVQDVLTQWTFELQSGRVFWLPDRLLSAVREIGLRALVDDRREENLVRVGLAQLCRVQWELVDPASSTRPVCNDHGAPIFTPGDVVPFDAVRLELSCIGRLVFPPRADLIRTNFCGTDLRNWRDSKSRNGLGPPGFFSGAGGNGVRVDLMRISGPTPYELRCYRNVKSHYERLSGRYVPPPS